MITTKDYIDKENQRTQLRKELGEIENELAQLNSMFLGGRRVSNYLEICERLKKRKKDIEIQMTEIKAWLRNNDKKSPTNPINQKPQKAYLDEYDLRNALSEPQRLLQLSYAAIQRLTKQIGIAESDRSLLDCLKDYLERHGMLV